MKIKNAYGLPESLVRAVENDKYDPGECNISVTRLIAPPRKVALEALHSKDLEEDVADRIWSLFGQAIHVILERADSTALTEKRLSIERQGWVISGQFDRLVVNDGLLQEYKVTSTYSVKDGGRSEWESQMNLLRAILIEHGFTVNKLQVIVLLRDWRKSFSERALDYPPSPILTIDIPIWSEERVEEFIDERIRLHQAARRELPACSESERWATPDAWALMKEGRKSAVRVYSSESEARTALQAAGPKHFLEHRPGNDIRCESYCPAAPWCGQARRRLPEPGTAPKQNKEDTPCP